MNPAVSIIICTRNRSDSLRKTLAAMAALDVPASTTLELVIVDNGSTDATADVAKTAPLEKFSWRYVYEPRLGLSHARNRGVAESAGEIILFTDDDVRPPSDWIVRMCEPILTGRADAVAGGVSIAPHLERPWLVDCLRDMLASTDRWNPHEKPQFMVGANMAIARKVFRRIPGFDPELGAGALGFGEETLLSRQIHAAGFRIALELAVCVEHHFDEGRLCRANFERIAVDMGRAHAYLAHHWEHRHILLPRLRLFVNRAKLWVRDLGHPSARGDFPAPWRVAYLLRGEFLRHSIFEAKRPRNYDRFGLAKRGRGAMAAAPSRDAILAAAEAPASDGSTLACTLNVSTGGPDGVRA